MSIGLIEGTSWPESNGFLLVQDLSLSRAGGGPVCICLFAIQAQRKLHISIRMSNQAQVRNKKWIRIEISKMLTGSWGSTCVSTWVYLSCNNKIYTKYNAICREPQNHENFGPVPAPDFGWYGSQPMKLPHFRECISINQLFWGSLGTKLLTHQFSIRLFILIWKMRYYCCAATVKCVWVQFHPMETSVRYIMYLDVSSIKPTVLLFVTSLLFHPTKLAKFIPTPRALKFSTFGLDSQLHLIIPF
jgi:hypothetical protein